MSPMPSSMRNNPKLQLPTEGSVETAKQSRFNLPDVYGGVPREVNLYYVSFHFYRDRA